MALRLVSPVPPSLALMFAGGRPFMRKVILYQTRRGEAVAILEDDEPVALAMLDRRRARRAELAIAFAPAARRHMLALVRLAQLTARRFAQNRILTFVHIRPDNMAGMRMAMATGFRPGGFRDRSIWLWRG
jgi:hypothetical protein